jgi:hypothetical protein
MSVSDHEIWTAANLIIKRLGAEARREAVERAGDMLVRGDAERVTLFGCGYTAP